MILDTLTLPSEMEWIDEFDWSLVKLKQRRTIQGNQIISGNKLPSDAGRPITLSHDMSWIPRADVITLYEWYNELGKEMHLTMNDLREYDVRFRHWETPAMTAPSLASGAWPESTTLHVLTLKLSII